MKRYSSFFFGVLAVVSVGCGGSTESAPVAFTTIQADLDKGGKLGIGCSSSTACHAVGAAQMTAFVPMATSTADLTANHAAFVAQCDNADPVNSMIIQKPLGNLAHGGGAVIEKGEPLYDRWITYIGAGEPQ